jgi:cold-inducible RNA-binding protein
MVNIFIANLDWTITSEDLKTTFSTFGEVHYAHVVFEKETKRSKGYGYVEMESAEAAIAAISALNGMEINGRAIDVKIASPKGNRPQKVEKVEEKRPFNKKPGFKSGYGNSNRQGGNRGGGNYQRRSDNGGGYQRRTDSEGGYQRRTDGEGGHQRNFDRPNYSDNSQRSTRPRRPRVEGDKPYERVERPSENKEETND